MTCEKLKKNGVVAIVGAGPAGVTLARILQIRGFSVKVFERDASPTSRSQGGSLDIRSDSGQLAVDATGLTDKFRRFWRPEAKSFQILDSHGNSQNSGDVGTHENAGPEIDRGDLRQILLNSLSPETVKWGQQVNNVLPVADGRWELQFDDGSSFTADLVVGADGVGSKVRPVLTSTYPKYIGMTMLAAIIKKEFWRDSKLSEIVGEGSVMFADHGQSIFVQRCSKDLIMLYYSLNIEEDWPKSRNFSLEDSELVLKTVTDSYKNWSPEIIKMLTQVDNKFHRWPLSIMPSDYSWKTTSGITMVGDSSHAMPPFTGKGVNLAMLDSLELANCLTDDPKAQIITAIEKFEKGMQERTRKETGACIEVGKNVYGLDLNSMQKQLSASS